MTINGGYKLAAKSDPILRKVRLCFCIPYQRHSTCFQWGLKAILRDLLISAPQYTFHSTNFLPFA